jgi:hypothetical protein
MMYALIPTTTAMQGTQHSATLKQAPQVFDLDKIENTYKPFSSVN